MENTVYRDCLGFWSDWNGDGPLLFFPLHLQVVHIVPRKQNNKPRKPLFRPQQLSVLMSRCLPSPLNCPFSFHTCSHFNHQGSAPFILSCVCVPPGADVGEGLANQISSEEQEQSLSLVAIQGDFKRDNRGWRNRKREKITKKKSSDADGKHAVTQC